MPQAHVHIDNIMRFNGIYVPTQVEGHHGRVCKDVEILI